MAFVPNTNLYIGYVPFDNSYRHVRYFSSKSEQYNKMMAWLGTGRTDFTYQRQNNSIVVPYNAEILYGYNYCMFQNANYGNKWFYSFITNIEYVNESSSRLTLQDDFMQTWFFDCTVPPCFVEREHVNDDSIGAHLKDEGLDTGELKCTWFALDNNEMTDSVVVASCAEPLKSGGYINVAGSMYNGVGSGTMLTNFTNMNDLKDYMNALSDNGQQDAVSAVYMVPDFVKGNTVAKDDGWGRWIQATEAGGTESETLNYTPPISSLDGYVPKNNKLFCYPFQYLEINNFIGSVQQLRFEFFDTYGTASIQKTGGVDQNSTLMYIPLNYNGVNRFLEGSVSLPKYPSCSWVYQSWANMQGQSNFELFGNQLNSLTDLPFYQAYGAGAMNLANSAASMNPLSMISDFAGGVMDVVNASASVQKMSKTPNTTKGGTNSSTPLINIGSYTMAFRRYCVRAEFAKMADDYLSAFGYLVSETKVPNFTGRQSWNYVKTVGANARGKVPSDYLAAINALLDRGVTFWHTDDVGNYSLSNSIV